MTIKKGDRFKCIKNVKHYYFAGKEYLSDLDGCITDEEGDQFHNWEPNYRDGVDEFSLAKNFQKIAEESPKPVFTYKLTKEEINNSHDFSYPIIDMTEDKRTFKSGAVRDTDSGKPLITSLQGYTRQRFGYHMAKNAKKYGKDNFLKGIPTEAYLESLDRHLAAYLAGDRSEDHLSSIIFNVQGVQLNEQKDGIPANHYFNQ